MQDEDFWALVAEVREAGNGDFAAMEGELKQLLEARDAETVLAFDQLLRARMSQAYSWPLWGAAYVVFGGCSDDGFMDFRASLVFMGQSVFDAALEDPDSLAEQEDETLESLAHEGLLYVASEVYEAKSGGERAPIEGDPAEPSGDQWDEDDEDALKALCPRLFERFW